jgi:hypothetical protein
LIKSEYTLTKIKKRCFAIRNYSVQQVFLSSGWSLLPATTVHFAFGLCSPDLHLHSFPDGHVVFSLLIANAVWDSEDASISVAAAATMTIVNVSFCFGSHFVNNLIENKMLYDLLDDNNNGCFKTAHKK